MRGKALLMLPVILAVLVFLMVQGIGRFQRGSSPLRRAVTVVPVATVRNCPTPQLPGWTRLYTTTPVYNQNLANRRIIEVTYLRSPLVGLATWHQQHWAFLISTVFGSLPTSLVPTLTNAQWPGRGAVLWENPQHWVLTVDWCVGGAAYRIHLTGIAPGAAAVVVQVLAAWRTSHAALFHCQSTTASVVCHPAGRGSPSAG